MFVYISTCFGHFSAHHQELNDCSGKVLLVVVGPAGPTTANSIAITTLQQQIQRLLLQLTS